MASAPLSPASVPEATVIQAPGLILATSGRRFLAPKPYPYLPLLATSAGVINEKFAPKMVEIGVAGAIKLPAACSTPLAAFELKGPIIQGSAWP